MCPESLQAADEVIESLLKESHDFSAHRNEIARVLFDNGIFEGNWDVTLRIDGMPALRAIQEDEYDQHMEEDEDKPVHEEQACYTCHACAYIWIVS